MKTFRLLVRFACLLIALFCYESLDAQRATNVHAGLQKTIRYSVANAHSHNDYQQPHPFTTAYNSTFGSMEADIFLLNDSLYVGHTIIDIALHKTLAALYLDPLLKQVNLHKGFPYAAKKMRLQLLIDLKTEGVTTLAALIKLLRKYPAITNCKLISIVITGNRPPVKDWPTYPSFIWFDGNIGDSYAADVLPKIAMVSGDFANFTNWKGSGQMPIDDSLKVVRAIAQVHAQGKKIRFWDAPDIANAWLHFMHWGVDWINTDHIEQLASFLLFRQSFQQQ